MTDQSTDDQVFRDKPKGRPDLPALTSLRFFAAFYVVLFHAAGPYVTSSVARSFVRTGFVAVDLFFVLSGFVLTYRYCTDEDRLATAKRGFWIARLARVYPVYLIGLLVGAPLYIETLHVHRSSIATTVMALVAAVPALILMQSWFYRTATSWNTPAWSLSVEAFLYLTFPFLMPRVAAWMRKQSSVGIGCLIVALWLVAMIPPLTYMAQNPDGILHVTHNVEGRWLDTLRFTPLFHLPSFVLGMVAGWLHIRRPQRAAHSWASALVLLATILILCAGAWIPYPMLHSGLLAPVFAAAVYCIARDSGYVARVLGARPLVALGDASYALYLLHFPLLLYGRKIAGGDLSFTEFVVFCAILQVICLLVYRYVEVPARKLIRRSPTHDTASTPGLGSSRR